MPRPCMPSVDQWFPLGGVWCDRVPVATGVDPVS